MLERTNILKLSIVGWGGGGADYLCSLCNLGVTEVFYFIVESPLLTQFRNFGRIKMFKR